MATGTINLTDLQARTTIMQYDLNLKYITYLADQDNWAPRFSMRRGTDTEQINEAIFTDILPLRSTPIGMSINYRTLIASLAIIKLKRFADGVMIDKLKFHTFKETLTDFVYSYAMMAAFLPTEGAADILNNGQTAAYTIYDGQPIFSNAHPKAGSTFSNLVGPIPLDYAGLQAVRTLMRRFPTDDPNYQLNVYPDCLFVPPELEVQMDELLFNTRKNTSGFNTESQLGKEMKPLMEGIADARLTDINDYVIGGSRGIVKPFMWIEHNEFKLSLVADIEPWKEIVKDKGLFRWSAEIFMVMWPTRPELILKVVN